MSSFIDQSSIKIDRWHVRSMLYALQKRNGGKLRSARPNLGSIRGFLPGRVPQELQWVVEDAARGCGRTARRQQWALWFARVCLAPHWSILTTSMDPFPRRKRARRQEGCATTSKPNNTQCARRITWSWYRRSSPNFASSRHLCYDLYRFFSRIFRNWIFRN